MLFVANAVEYPTGVVQKTMRFEEEALANSLFLIFDLWLNTHRSTSVAKYTTVNKASLMKRFNMARQERLKRRGKEVGDDFIDENGEINLQAEMEEMNRAVAKMKTRLAKRNRGGSPKRRRSVVRTCVRERRDKALPPPPLHARGSEPRCKSTRSRRRR